MAPAPAKLPAAQGEHVAAFATLEKVPASHALHPLRVTFDPGWQPVTVHLLAPVAPFVDVPLGQGVQLAEPLLANVFTGHLVHELAPPDEKVPLAQGEHVVALLVPEKVPGAQGTQLPSTCFVPRAHCTSVMHVLAPVAPWVDLPVGQGVQLAEPTLAANVSIAQGEQDWAPAAANLPGGHGTHPFEPGTDPAGHEGGLVGCAPAWGTRSRPPNASAPSAIAWVSCFMGTGPPPLVVLTERPRITLRPPCSQHSRRLWV